MQSELMERPLTRTLPPLILHPFADASGPGKLMDSSRLLGLGWKPQIDLETGIHFAYEDYLTRFAASKA